MRGNMQNNFYEEELCKINSESVKNTGLPLKYSLQTYGCQMNEHDSEQVEFIFENSGFEKADKLENADVILVNTCAIRGTAENKILGFLGSIKRLKNKEVAPKIIVSGCLPLLDEAKDNLIKKYRHIDVLMGTANYQKLPELIYRSIHDKEMIIEISNQFDLDSNELNYNRLFKHKSFVNIMYGCNNFCTYCVVPYTRGRETSREVEDIIDEIETLVADGVKEITLLGQNVNSYGKTLEVKTSFVDLLKEINEIEGLERIRFMTSHPKDISDELLQAFNSLDKLSNHLHLPVQSGSNRVLEGMNRRYTREKYLDLIAKVSKYSPSISLSTDIIVGFPGETEEDFEATLDLVREARYDFIFSFLYSPREGTPASEMEQVPHTIKMERFNRLVEVCNEISLEKNKEYLGRTVEVLVDEYSKNNKEYLSGRTDTFKLVNFKGSGDLIGKIVNVKIDKVNTFALEGTLE